MRRPQASNVWGGWFAGPLIGAGIGVLVLCVVAIRWGLGWLWLLLALGLGLVAALINVELVPLSVGLALAAPALAALTTDPGTGRARRWTLGATATVAVVVVSLGITGVAELNQARTQQRLLQEAGIGAAESAYVQEESPQPAGRLDRGSGVRYARYTVRRGEQAATVRLIRADSSDLDPPDDCSDDPAATAPCRQVSPVVFTDPESFRKPRIVVVEQTVVVLRDDTPGTDLEGTGVLDELAAGLRPVTPGALTDRFCLPCRLLPGG